jgi:hypothetical protein
VLAAKPGRSCRVTATGHPPIDAAPLKVVPLQLLLLSASLPAPSTVSCPSVSALVCWYDSPGSVATRLPRSSLLAAPPRNSVDTI